MPASGCCCSTATISGDAAARISGFKSGHSFPGSVSLRLAFLLSAFRGEPSGRKASIRLPDFHLRDLDEVRLDIHLWLRHTAEPGDRSCQETIGKQTMLRPANAFRLSDGMPGHRIGRASCRERV